MTDMRRVLSGAAVAVVGFALILHLETRWWMALAAAVCVLLAHEWVRMTGDNPGLRASKIALTLAVILALYEWPGYLPWFLAATGAWWLVAFACTVSYTAGRPCDPLRSFLFRIGPLLVLPALWAAAVHMHMENRWWLLYVIALVSLSDIGAYYVGRRFGDAPLCPDLSPGKTRAGLWGGLGASLVFCAATAFFVAPVWLDGVHLALVSLCAVQVGVVGDLFISMLKRYSGVKDTGAILPGHGGALDRLDSLLPALPLFFVVMSGRFL